MCNEIETKSQMIAHFAMRYNEKESQKFCPLEKLGSLDILLRSCFLQNVLFYYLRKSLTTMKLVKRSE